MRREFCIPGYGEAIESERKAREEIYLDTPYFICGVAVKQITPRLLARLFRMETPFLGACELELEIHVPQFLWALHVSYSRDPRVRRDFTRLLRWRIEQGDFDLVEASEEIDDFLELTFMDAPCGKEETPYACSNAWLEFRMAGDPFRWDTDRTLDTPLRRTYQLIRCQLQENGATLNNKLSDVVKGDWLALFSKAINSIVVDKSKWEFRCFELDGAKCKIKAINAERSFTITGPTKEEAMQNCLAVIKEQEQQAITEKLNRMHKMSEPERKEFLAQINSFRN